MNSASLPAPRRRLADRVGLVLSGLCAVHCAALPIALAVLGSSGSHAVHDVVHPVLAVVLVPVTLRAMRPASTARAWLVGGLVAVWLGVAAHVLGGDGLGTAFTLFGSTLLLLGHRLNGCASPSVSS